MTANDVVIPAVSTGVYALDDLLTPLVHQLSESGLPLGSVVELSGARTRCRLLCATIAGVFARRGQVVEWYGGQDSVWDPKGMYAAADLTWRTGTKLVVVDLRGLYSNLRTSEDIVDHREFTYWLAKHLQTMAVRARRDGVIALLISDLCVAGEVDASRPRPQVLGGSAPAIYASTRLACTIKLRSPYLPQTQIHLTKARYALPHAEALVEHGREVMDATREEHAQASILHYARHKLPDHPNLPTDWTVLLQEVAYEMRGHPDPDVVARVLRTLPAGAAP